MIKKTKILSMLLTLLLIVSVLASCDTSSNSTTTGTTTKQDESYTVTLVGSTSVGKLAEPLAMAFEATHSTASIEVQGGGSSTGVAQAIAASCDIGMASRNLKEAEQDQGLTEYVIAIDGIAVVVSPNNTVSDLTIQQIQGLFSGDITNWNEVGGSDKPVVVVSRESGSGTRGAFEEILDLEDKVLETIVQESTGGVRTTVSTNENAIGYISAGSISEDVKALSISGIECTVDNIKSGVYTVSRPLLMLTKGALSEGTQTFIDWVLGTEGQAIALEEGFVPVN